MGVPVGAAAVLVVPAGLVLAGGLAAGVPDDPPQAASTP